MRQVACQQGLRRMALCVGGVNGEDQSIFYSRKNKKTGCQFSCFCSRESVFGEANDRRSYKYLRFFLIKVRITPHSMSQF